MTTLNQDATGEMAADGDGCMRILERQRLDRRQFEIADLHANQENGWLTRTPSERLEGLETLRQIWHDYDPDTARLPRVYTLVERKRR